MAKGRYSFSLGTEPQRREYAGKLLPPLEGFRTGAKVIALLGDLVGLSEDSDLSASFMRAIFKLDADICLNLVLEVLEKSAVYAKVEGSTDSILLHSKDKINKWFEEYREDLPVFCVQVLLQNSTPFLPVDLREQVLTVFKKKDT